IGKSPRELNVAGEHAREFVALVLPRGGRLSSEQEMRLIRSPGTRYSHNALAASRIATAHVVDRVLGVGLVAVLPVHDLSRFAEERGLLKELLAGLAGKEQIDLLQVLRPVMAGDARQVDTEKDLRVRDGELVDGVRKIDQVVRVGRLRIVLRL